MFKGLKFKNLFLSSNAQRGQSLVEVIVAIGIAAVFLGAGVAAIAPIIRNNLETRTIQFADSLAQDYANKAKNFSESNWTSLYNLSKGSGNNYMLIASGTQTLVVEGQESSPDQDVVSGLVGHWKFDEATSTQAYDFSGNGNGGILTNGPVRTASSSCTLGNCLSFDGTDDYIEIPFSSSLNTGGEALTLSAWSKTSNLIDTNEDWIIAQEDDVFKMSTYNSKLYCYIEDESCLTRGSSKTLSNTTGDVYNIFSCVFDFNNGIITYYQNGASLGTTALTGDNLCSLETNPLRIGRSASVYFNGLIDDVRVYNRALSANEVKQLYNSRKYLRSFSVENVNRDSCGVGNISTEATSTCSTGPGTTGVADDPSTQKITINVNWSGGGSAGSAISKIQYLARTANLIFNQTDWSGGYGQDGPITSANNQFSTSTNINYSGTQGSIMIMGY